ncbi:MAG: hypothetical protein SGJ15_13295 [Bacteroidota bacterium]|nr:hypothetical protein [Bacteroidota bacterium]
MRYIPIIFSLALALSFSNCGSNKVIYAIAEDHFVFERDSIPYGNNKLLKESSASFLTYEFDNKKGPLKIYVRFDGMMPNINTIESIDLELIQKNDKGEIVKLHAKELSEFKVEYSNGRSIVSLPIRNEHICSQVNWKEANWGEYTQNSSVGFVGTFIFELEEYPTNLMLSFKINWKNREKQFETTLTKEVYVGPKFNPKY